MEYYLTFDKIKSLAGKLLVAYWGRFNFIFL